MTDTVNIGRERGDTSEELQLGLGKGVDRHESVTTQELDWKWCCVVCVSEERSSNLKKAILWPCENSTG